MSELFGHTRDIVKERYALRTPGGFVPSHLPGWRDCTVVIHISSGMGANFAQIQIDLAKNGEGGGATGEKEFVAYILRGSCRAILGGKKHTLTAGSFAYVPPHTDYQFSGSGARLLIFEKTYTPLAGRTPPAVVVGHKKDAPAKPFLGQKGALLQVLLPDDPSFDLAVNIFTYQPGATLPFVETHIMEHGLLMLEGQGIYRLDADWHPVQAGDVIWMAPYCPQWFAAIGETPAGYIYYKDVNRAP
ncbi:MAG TPA: (S)-ureidoglycine aminohydrolase [Verrucomicrobiae bacterium]|jgi:(S)-ureidoglycine aminohydrolase|nr:(S)-ureidoglycine aminohydrolase [Verrucomicrobiae bacterium]